jgi:hypothetical protein
VQPLSNKGTERNLVEYFFNENGAFRPSTNNVLRNSLMHQTRDAQRSPFRLWSFLTLTLFIVLAPPMPTEAVAGKSATSRKVKSSSKGNGRQTAKQPPAQRYEAFVSIRYEALVSGDFRSDTISDKRSREVTFIGTSKVLLVADGQLGTHKFVVATPIQDGRPVSIESFAVTDIGTTSLSDSSAPCPLPVVTRWNLSGVGRLPIAIPTPSVMGVGEQIDLDLTAEMAGTYEESMSCGGEPVAAKLADTTRDQAGLPGRRLEIGDNPPGPLRIFSGFPVVVPTDAAGTAMFRLYTVEPPFWRPFVGFPVTWIDGLPRIAFTGERRRQVGLTDAYQMVESVTYSLNVLPTSKVSY